ncbi:M12 family metallo-peptidase [Spirosoma fluviale]|uniref:Por secretion system C-terminal sorting domain-containing protein n=1 Tax=Spirosoma fluviale TaxID=1597977 RepID=A0A286G2K4_9BACT|nr:M12 family metallo-peptidase [Spirosoma fluviale]SOD89751.1 Por secretion system C-terminal sorting domain-containing protein [Spirosoma fluviale]
MQQPFTAITALCLLLLSGCLLAQAPDPRFGCKTDDTQLSPAIIQMMQTLGRSSKQGQRQATQRLECRIAIDVDNDLYRAFGGDAAEIKRYVYQTIAESSAVFERDLNIKLVVTYIKIWDSPDPYTRKNDIGIHLADMAQWWRQNQKSIPRDFLIGYSAKTDPVASGIAYLASNGFSEAAVIGYNLPGATDRIPTITHEIGHMMGSPHTHSCSWPGGPIDFCGKAEGSCYTGPQMARIGTVMSYCHTVTGGKQETSFHPLCIELMRRNAEIALAGKAVSQLPDVPTGVTVSSATRPDPYLEWTPAKFAEQYRIQLASSADFSTGMALDAIVIYPMLQAENLIPGVSYFWRVKARNSIGESSWSVSGQIIITNSSTLRPPALQQPETGAQNVANNLVSWYPVEGATSYHVQAHYSPDMASPYLSKTVSASVTSFNLSSDNNFGNCQNSCWIYWRVKVTKDGKESDWSPLRTYRRKPEIAGLWPTPTGSSAVLHQLSVPISWYDYSNEAATSRIQLARSADFSTLVFDKSLIYNQLGDATLRNGLVITADSLQPNTTYYYRVKVNAAGAESDWQSNSFRTGGDGRRWNFANPANTNLPATSLNQLAFDTTGAAWMTTGGGLYRSTEGTNWVSVNATNPVLPTGATALTFNRQNRGYVLANYGIYAQNGTGWIQIPNPPGVTYPFGTLAAGDNNLLFLITYNTVYRYDGTRWTTYEAPDLVASGSIYGGVVDASNHLWIGYYGKAGIGHFDGSRWEAFSNLPIENMASILIDQMGKTIYAGGYNGIVKLATATKSIESISSKTITGADFQNFLQLGISADNNLVVSTSTSLYRNDGKVWSSQPVIAPSDYNTVLRVGPDNRIWLLNKNHGLSVYEPRTLTSSLAKALYCPGDTIPVAFTANFTPKPGTTYRTELSDPTGLRFSVINSTVASSKATLRLSPSQLPGSQYKVRLAATQGGITVYGDESSVFTVNAAPKATVSPGSAAFCAGTPFALQATTDPGASLQWLMDGTPVNGSTSLNYAVTQSGTYAVAASLNGCQKTSAPVSLTVKEGVTATVTPQSSTLVYAPSTVSLLANSGTGYTYQWYRDGTAISGATSLSYAADKSGSFAVLVTGPNGCSATAAAVTVRIDILLAVDPALGLGDWQLTPNPVERSCTVSFSASGSGPVTLLLLDANGRTVLRQTVPRGQTKTDLDVGLLPTGTYILRAATGESESQKRLVKQ